jgi:hypothetical protein
MRIDLPITDEYYAEIEKYSELCGMSVESYLIESITKNISGSGLFKSKVWSWIEQGGEYYGNYEYLSICDEDGMRYSSDLYMRKCRLTHIPYKFACVEGTFDVSNNNLTSFENFPDEVEGDINVSGNPNMVLPDYLNDAILRSSDSMGYAVGTKRVFYKHNYYIVDYDLFIKTKRQLKLNQFA